MKQLYIKLLILLDVILIVVIIFLGLKINSIKNTNSFKFFAKSLCDEKVSPNLTPLKLPMIYIDGNKIKRYDTKCEVIFKGLTSESLRGTKPDFDLAKKHIEITKRWGANIINFYYNPVPFFDEKNLLELDKIIEYSNKNKLYVSLQPVVSYKDNWSFHENSENTLKAKVFLSKVEKLVPILAKRYKKYSNILYGIWTEPHPSGIHDEYIETAKRTIRNIQHINPMAISMIDTSLENWNSYNHEGPIDIPNIIYHKSYYYGKDKNSIGIPKVEGPELIRSSNKDTKAPYMLIEMGAYYDKDFNSPEDIETTVKILEVVRKNNISYIGYILDYSHVLALVDQQGNPTKKGEIFKEDLERYPPTLF